MFWPALSEAIDAITFQRQQRLNDGWINRLYEQQINVRLDALLTAQLLIGPAADGDDQAIPFGEVPPQLSRDLETIQERHSNIEKHHVRMLNGRDPQRGGAVIGEFDGMAPVRNLSHQAVGRVMLVVNYQHRELVVVNAASAR
jgi:hypothetical protein